MTEDINELIETCETLWSDFNNCKAHFPYTPISAKGQMAVRTAPYYIQQGFDIRFQFNQPLSEQSISKINQIGH